MNTDTVINGMAHELWAIAQGQAPIDDVVQIMVAKLQKLADDVVAAECDAIADEIIDGWPGPNGKMVAELIRAGATELSSHIAYAVAAECDAKAASSLGRMKFGCPPERKDNGKQRNRPA